MKRQAIQVLAAGLIAAAALACGEAVSDMMASAGSGGGAGVGSANAQSTCSSWQVMAVVRDCEDVACDIPAGWEPFSAHNNFFDGIWLRRCVQ